MAVSPRCARPGCGGVATAWLSYDYAGMRVWLDDPGVETAGHHSALCATHAGRLRPPQGWSCQDRRTSGANSLPPLSTAGQMAGSHLASERDAPPAIAV